MQRNRDIAAVNAETEYLNVLCTVGELDALLDTNGEVVIKDLVLAFADEEGGRAVHHLIEYSVPIIFFSSAVPAVGCEMAIADDSVFTSRADGDSVIKTYTPDKLDIVIVTTVACKVDAVIGCGCADVDDVNIASLTSDRIRIGKEGVGGLLIVNYSNSEKSRALVKVDECLSVWIVLAEIGEELCSRNRTKVTSIQRPARLKYYELSWYAGGYEYFGELWFQEEEMLHLFDEAYGEDRMQEGVLLIAYSEENESFEVTLQVGGKKYAFEKTEVWISKIPEVLETDGKAQRERVFKNFEGDNRNEFRVK